MDAKKLFEKYYQPGTPIHDLVWQHSSLVARKAMQITDECPDLHIDRDFVYEAALLHDIGVFLTDAPSICCTGSEPYIRHGILGAELLRNEGYPLHARVCERHTGSGITREEIIAQGLPLPPQDLLPESLEEKLVCYADKFFSKSHPDREKKIEKIKKGLAAYGDDSIKRFEELEQLFLPKRF